MAEEGKEPTGGEPEVSEKQPESTPPTPGEAGAEPDAKQLQEALDQAEKARKAAEAQARTEREKRQQWEQQYQSLHQQQKPDEDFDPYDRDKLKEIVRQELTQEEATKHHKAFMGSRPQDVDDEMFDRVGTTLSQEAAQLIKSQDNAWDIIKHLGNDEAALKRLNGKSGADAAFELGQVVSKMNPPAKQSNAPDPVEPVGGGADVGGQPADGASLDQWETWVKKQNDGSVFPKSSF